MSEIKINISELKSEGSDIVKELAQFLEEKTGAKIETGTDDITVKEDKELSRYHLRMLLRKFVHKKELKDYYRIIGGKDNTLIVKEIKETEEE